MIDVLLGGGRRLFDQLPQRIELERLAQRDRRRDASRVPRRPVARPVTWASSDIPRTLAHPRVWRPGPEPDRERPSRASGVRSTSVASRRARVAPGPVALAGTSSGVEVERAVGPERLLLRDRRRRTPAAVRSAGRAERDLGACDRARDGDRAHCAVARAGLTTPRGAARRARVYAVARYRAVPHGHVRPHCRASRRRQSRRRLAAP